MGFLLNRTDPSLFVDKNNGDIVFLLIYIDNVLVRCSNPNLVTDFIKTLSVYFALKDLGSFIISLA